MMDSKKVQDVILGELLGYDIKIVDVSRRRKNVFYVKCKFDMEQAYRIGNQIIYLLPEGWRLISVYFGYTTGIATYTVSYRKL
jgi:hypothetical protein